MKLVVIGDSTSGTKLKKDGDGTVGWAEYINNHLDNNITGINRCVVGWGIRDFFNRSGGAWLEHTLDKLESGDIMLACFGTLERSPLSRTDFGGFGARGSLPGDHDQYEVVYDEHYKVEYNVYSFGWYLRRLVEKTKERGIKLYFLSQIPRNTWEDGKHKRTYSIDYAKIMENISNETGVGYLDANQLISEFLQAIGQETSQDFYDPKDKSHTTPTGAKIYANLIADELNKKYKLY